MCVPFLRLNIVGLFVYSPDLEVFPCGSLDQQCMLFVPSFNIVEEAVGMVAESITCELFLRHLLSPKAYKHFLCFCVVTSDLEPVVQKFC